MTPPVHNREEAIQLVADIRYGYDGAMHNVGMKLAERIVDDLFPQPDPEVAYDPRMDDVRWTITGLDAFKAEVWDGPMLPKGARVLVAPAAALERALEEVKRLSDYVRDAAGDESVLLNAAVLEQFSESEAHKLRLKLGEVERLTQVVEYEQSVRDATAGELVRLRERAERAEERLRTVEGAAEKVSEVWIACPDDPLLEDAMFALGAVLSSQEPSTDHTEEEL